LLAADLALGRVGAYVRRAQLGRPRRARALAVARALDRLAVGAGRAARLGGAGVGARRAVDPVAGAGADLVRRDALGPRAVGHAPPRSADALGRGPIARLALARAALVAAHAVDAGAGRASLVARARVAVRQLALARRGVAEASRRAVV